MSSHSRFVPLVLETDTSFNMIKNYLHSACKSFLCLFFLVLISFSSFSQEISKEAAAITAGGQIFNANCKACHAVDRKVVGPALGGVYDRAPSIDWIKRFVKNSSAVIASGDDYAVNLYNEYGKTRLWKSCGRSVHILCTGGHENFFCHRDVRQTAAAASVDGLSSVASLDQRVTVP